MTTTLDLIKGTSAESLDSVRSDFDDLPRGHFRAATKTGMTRIIDATAEERSAAAKERAATRRPARAPRMTPVEVREDAHNGDRCDNPRCCPPEGPVDRRSPRQIELMADLHMQLAELDPKVCEQAVAYTTKMTAEGKWTPGRWNPATGEGNASRWIGNMIAKVRELRDATKTAPVAAPTADIPALPVKTDKNGKPMPLYYAVGTDENVKFYRIKPGRKPGFYFVDVQASDEFHPVKFPNAKASIIKAIVDAGAEDCMARYGQLIGSCGRCGRTLTDPESRAAGIGPDCRSKGWG